MDRNQDHTSPALADVHTPETSKISRHGIFDRISR